MQARMPASQSVFEPPQPRSVVRTASVAIGGGHVPHVIRRNVDITYIVMDNQVYGLTKGQLSPTAAMGTHTVTSPEGSIEAPVNPLLYVLGYGAHFVAQGTPGDMPGLTAILEEAIRFPGFSFVNVQSPCVTFGAPEQQLKAHKEGLRKLSAIDYDPTHRMKAMALAQTYGKELWTGVFYRDPNPPPTYDALVRERQRHLAAGALPRERILDLFVKH